MKMFTSLFLFAVAPLLTLAVKQPPGGLPIYFKVTSREVPNAPYENALIHANKGRLALLNPTLKVDCDRRFHNCTDLPQAVFQNIYAADFNGKHPLKNIDAAMRMDTLLPELADSRGQRVYISPSGRFSFAASKEGAPKGSITTGFQAGAFAEFQVLNPDRSGETLKAFACKESKGPGYEIFYKLKGVKLPKHCDAINILTAGTVASAMKYK